jgi:hypothetical protein
MHCNTNGKALTKNKKLKIRRGFKLVCFSTYFSYTLRCLNQKNLKQKISWYCPFKEVVISNLARHTFNENNLDKGNEGLKAALFVPNAVKKSG